MASQSKETLTKHARCFFYLQDEKLSQVIKASGNSVEGYWPGLFAKALKGQDITKLLSNVGTAAPAATGGAATGGDSGAKEDKKEESK